MGPVISGRFYRSDENSRHQLALRIPGTLPSRASFRSMMRLTRNFRYTPRDLPVSSQRRTIRDENFGVRFDLATCAFVAIGYLLSGLRNGNPSSSRTNRLISGLEREKQMLMFMPWVNCALAMSISGKTPCSLTPIE